MHYLKAVALAALSDKEIHAALIKGVRKGMFHKLKKDTKEEKEEKKKKKEEQKSFERKNTDNNMKSNKLSDDNLHNFQTHLHVDSRRQLQVDSSDDDEAVFEQRNTDSILSQARLED